MVIVVPAYQPGETLVDLVASIRTVRPEAVAVVVDDGSGPDWSRVFSRVRDLGAVVLGYPVNRGKGHALKVAFSHVARTFPGHAVVCADADGQHRIEDILAVAEQVRDGAIILGSRRLAGPVPLRSRVGNAVTRVAFRLATGIRVHDTQTGLRGVGGSLLGWLGSIPGERYEYELNVLLRATEERIDLDEVPIASVYLAGNASSHFHPLADSARIYGQLARFSLSSLGAFLIDAGALLAFQALTGSLLLSAVMARVISASFNFLTNRKLVFALDGSRLFARSALRYAVLVGCVLGANYLLLSTLTQTLGLGLLAAKLLTEVVLFSLSYRLQQRFVFGRAVPSTGALPPELQGSRASAMAIASRG